MNNANDNKKSSSQRRQDASRANGAKSKGPITPEGKQVSSRNATTHGFLATLVTLTPEEETAFNEIHDLYIARFEPRDQVEHDLLEQAVVANFRIRQIWVQETALIGLQMALDKDKVDMEWRNPTEYDRRALAFLESINDSNALSLLHRYSRSHALQSERAIKMLLELKKLRLPPACDPAQPHPVEEPQPESQNEPNPEIEQPEMLPKAPVAHIPYAQRPVRVATVSNVTTMRTAAVPHQPAEKWRVCGL
jgi:hypothetical protein